MTKVESKYAGVRLLDRVTVKGSTAPIELYTFDTQRGKSTCSVTHKEYKVMFEKAVRLYLDGQWPEAIERLNDCQEVMYDDYPAELLLDFMNKKGGIAPDDWKGYRVLNDK